ncbi:MAG TPA: glycerol kinase GlpK [Gemmatimonadaceae bacterium]|jgi:glycerol kinase|nr:glycerol kinase GlpK [Gemmatimonadaceae bacterium]
MPVLALDAGTTSTRAMVFADDGSVLAQVQRPFTQHFPADGWVEHDADEIFVTTIACARDALAAARLDARGVAGIGIAVQRETIVVWNRATGVPVQRAIVWQDRRTAERCRELADDPAAVELVGRTGLLLDPYFSATKLAWILDHAAGARAAAERGELLAGTIDTWLLWKLTGGRVHATDATNASRTLLFDIYRQAWDEELCVLFGVPSSILPAVHDSADDFGTATPDLFGAPIMVRALVGDQQAGAVGQDCVAPGQAKATYGTGCFVLVNTGDAARVSRHRLLGTIALRLAGRTTYALEGSIFNAGTVVQWLRDQLGLIEHAAESATVAASIPSSDGVYCVPAFTGLGAPWWDPDARAALTGLTRDSGRAHIVRAALESVAFQTRDLATAFAEDGVPLAALRVDGGMAANDWLMQTIADQLRIPVERPVVLETTAWGAARLAGLHAGIYPPLGTGGMRRVERTFNARAAAAESDAQHVGWLRAIARVRS